MINATFFGSLGQRVLPTSPGRTTRCTTELHYDSNQLPSIQLLPTMIDTSIQQQPLSVLKNKKGLWSKKTFSAQDRLSIEKALSHIAEVEMVSVDQAVALGYVSSHEKGDVSKLDLIDGKIAIPKWRHAVINFPHHLLRHGVSIIDTPGLNSLGIELEQTLKAIDSAHAIVFVLSADTGVTRSELAVWQQYIKSVPAGNVLVVLNKIDTLWDDLNSTTVVRGMIEKQARDVARILDIDRSRVHTLSATKAMLARTCEDRSLLVSSGIELFEGALAETVNAASQKNIMLRIRTELDPSISALSRLINNRIDYVDEQCRELEHMRRKSGNLTEKSMAKVKKDRVSLHSVVDRFKSYKNEMSSENNKLKTQLSLAEIDKVIALYRLEIGNQLTSAGIMREMEQFHVDVSRRYEMALYYISRLEKKVTRIFDSMQGVLAINGLSARRLRPEVYEIQLRKLALLHEQNAKGIGAVLTEQLLLRNRYQTAVMFKVRGLYKQTVDDIELWCRTVLVPIELEIKERQAHLRRRLSSLERIQNSDADLNRELEFATRRYDQYMKPK